MPQDLRTYLDELTRRYPEQLKVVEQEVDPVFGATALVDKIDVTKLLPLLWHNELDAGKYITSAATICRDPATGKQNLGIFRHQLQGPRQLGFMTNPAHD